MGAETGGRRRKPLDSSPWSAQIRRATKPRPHQSLYKTIKAAVFTDAGLLSGRTYWLPVLGIPLMLVSIFAGRRFNTLVGE